MVTTRMLERTHTLRLSTDKAHFRSFAKPVAFVYRPLEYARALADAYVARFAQGTKEVVFVGMNPGPFGMGQTGVPFGEVSFVRDWMKLDGTVLVPKDTHPKRPISGLACPRSEVSGRRLWGAFAATFPRAEDFFARAWVVNYCPLLFLGATGANVTPDKLAAKERLRLERVCDEHLSGVLDLLRPKHVVGVGGYATKRIERVAKPTMKIATMPHPSPASPTANRGWEAAAKKALEAAGIRGLIR